MFDLSIPIALMAGVVSFFAPCVFPLLPVYISYITGISIDEVKSGDKKFRNKVLFSSLFYILGFSLVFVLLGLTVSSVSGVLFSNKNLLQRVGGLLIIVFGLEFSGFVNIPLLSRSWQPEISKKVGGYTRSFLVGVIFSISWSACTGVILGSILTLAASRANAALGALYLFVYSLGMSIPFLLVSLTISSFPKYLKVVAKYSNLISKVSGVVLIIVGFLLLTDSFKFLNFWVFSKTM